MLLSIIVPLHNEEGNFSQLVESLDNFIKEKKINTEVVLVDDKSSDSTPRMCDEAAAKRMNYKIIHRRNVGEERGNTMGAALKDGVRMANGDVIVWLMGDLSDDLDVIPKFIEKIESGADVVIGSRYMKGGAIGDLSRFKAFCSASFGFLAHVLYRMKVHDVTNAFRAFRKEAFEKSDVRSNDFGISLEFAVKAHKKGFKVDEVPASYKNRRAGKASFKMFKMGLRYISILLGNLF